MRGPQEGLSCAERGYYDHRHIVQRSVIALIFGAQCGRLGVGVVLVARGSAQTFRGLISYVHAHRPSMVLFENVDRLADEVHTTSAGSSRRDEGGAGQQVRSNMDILMAEMSARESEGQRFLVDAKSFGLPCRCRRAYCVFVRVVACHAFRFSKRSVSAVCRTLCKMTAACQRMPPVGRRLLVARRRPGIGR